MKTQMKTLFVFLMAAAVAVSCGKNESGGGSDHDWAVGGDYSVIGGGGVNTQASQQAFNAARNWFNGSERSQAQTGVFAKVFFNKYNSNVNQNCSNGSLFGLFDYTYCSGNNSNSYSSIKYVCTYSGYMNNQNNYSVGSKEVSNYQDCMGNNISATTYNKNNNVELKKVLSLNGNQWALYQAQNNNGIITISVGPKVNGNIYNPAPTHYYQINTNIHSIYNPVYIETPTTIQMNQ